MRRAAIGVVVTQGDLFHVLVEVISEAPGPAPCPSPGDEGAHASRIAPTQQAVPGGVACDFHGNVEFTRVHSTKHTCLEKGEYQRATAIFR